MSYEVELKFPVEDPAALIAAVRALGAQRAASVRQVDTYFHHPSRDFAATDEALRIRTVNGGAVLTYKGPLVDETTKTRPELEVPVGHSPEDVQRLFQLLQALGFRPLREVRKQRDLYELDWENRPVQFCVDEVDGLGRFVELETAADADALDEARQSLLRLAARLGLENSERRSYLCLLLKQDRS